MKNKSFVVLLAAMFAVFALTGVALAENRVEVKVTSEPIPQYSTCDKAGGFSLQFDSNTRLGEDGLYADDDTNPVKQRITIDLDQDAYLCKPIDIMISPFNDANLGGTGTGWNVTNWATQGAPFIVTADPNGLDPAPATVDPDGYGVYFHVYSANQDPNPQTRRIIVDVISVDGDGDGIHEGWLEVGQDAQDSVTIFFLDQKVNDDYPTNGVWIDPADDGTYEDAALLKDNTICVDVSDFDEKRLLANMDSDKDRFTFIPSNPQIAHFYTRTITKVECGKPRCGNIRMGTGDQAADCDFIDNETGAGYCAGTHRDNRMIIHNPESFNVGNIYQLTVQVLVNGTQSANQGVYLSNEPVAVGMFEKEEDACNGAAVPVGGDTTYYYSSGDTLASEGAAPEPPNNNCSVDDDSKAVSLITDADGVSLANDDGLYYMYVNLPSLNYDLDEIDEGDEVTVRVILNELPCSTVFDETHCIGEFGCTALQSQLFFPYFTPMEGDGYWDGFVVENLGGTDGQATVTVYEQDGDIATATIDVEGHSMYVGLLSDILPDMTMTDESDGDGTLGNSRCYVLVCTNFNSDGFAMMGNSGTGESMGYLPRNNPVVGVAVLGAGWPGDSWPLCPDLP